MKLSKERGKLFVVSAPSGCGKGTLLEAVFEEGEVFKSVSCTTRQPREGEVNGVHYHFITDAEFEKMIEEERFLEHAGFVGKYYGTPEEPVEKNLSEGTDVILEIETQGAFQIREVMPEAVLLFILPPSVKELERRLYKRGTEKADVIAKRVAEAGDEIRKSVSYDYVIMNDDLDDAVRDFDAVVKAVRNNDDSADKFSPKNEEVKKLIEEVLNYDA